MQRSPYIYNLNGAFDELWLIGKKSELLTMIHIYAKVSIHYNQTNDKRTHLLGHNLYHQKP